MAKSDLGDLIARLESSLRDVDAGLTVVPEKGLLAAVLAQLNEWSAEVVALTAEELIVNADLAGTLPDGEQRVVVAPPEEGISSADYRAWRDKIAACDAGITSATGIAAETGTILLPPLVPDQRPVSLLPDKHLLVFPASRIVATIDELFILGAEQGSFDGNAVFVTGPSRTADIEKELVLGVHGPRALHVILIEG